HPGDRSSGASDDVAGGEDVREPLERPRVTGGPAATADHLGRRLQPDAERPPLAREDRAAHVARPARRRAGAAARGEAHRDPAQASRAGALDPRGPLRPRRSAAADAPADREGAVAHARACAADRAAGDRPRAPSPQLTSLFLLQRGFLISYFA